MNQVKIELGDPIVIAQAPKDVKRWGPYQFPVLEK